MAEKFNMAKFIDNMAEIESKLSNIGIISREQFKKLKSILSCDIDSNAHSFDDGNTINLAFLSGNINLMAFLLRNINNSAYRAPIGLANIVELKIIEKGELDMIEKIKDLKTLSSLISRYV